VPAGKYVLFARVQAQRNPTTDDAAVGGCRIPGDFSGVIILADELTDQQPLTSAISHPGGAIELTCTETSGDFQVGSASLSGVKVDALG
jgi:hypothetical protein